MNTHRRSKPARSVKRHARRSHSKPRRSHRIYSGLIAGSPCRIDNNCSSNERCYNRKCKKMDIPQWR